MHELSLCENLIDQLTALTRQHAALGVSRVVVQVGGLSGVEPQLLATAFEIARAGTVAAEAELITECTPPEVHCSACAADSATRANDLRCPVCGSEATELIAGQSLILAQVELLRPAMP